MRTPAPVYVHRDRFQVRGFDAVLVAAATLPDMINIVSLRDRSPVSQFPGQSVHQLCAAFPAAPACGAVPCPPTYVALPQKATRAIRRTLAVLPEAPYRVTACPAACRALPARGGQPGSLLRTEDLTTLVFRVRDCFEMARFNALAVTAAAVLHMIDLMAGRDRADSQQIRNTVRDLSLALPPHLAVTGVPDHAGPQQAARTIRGTLSLRPEPVSIG